jgi:hypothetical protein
MALGRIGPGAAEAVPALAATLKDPDNDVREAAAVALERINVKNRITRKRGQRRLVQRAAAVGAMKPYTGPPLD